MLEFQCKVQNISVWESKVSLKDFGWNVEKRVSEQHRRGLWLNPSMVQILPQFSSQFSSATANTWNYLSRQMSGDLYLKSVWKSSSTVVTAGAQERQPNRFSEELHDLWIWSNRLQTNPRTYVGFVHRPLKQQHIWGIKGWIENTGRAVTEVELIKK